MKKEKDNGEKKFYVRLGQEVEFKMETIVPGQPRWRTGRAERSKTHTRQAEAVRTACVSQVAFGVRGKGELSHRLCPILRLESSQEFC